MRANRRLSLAKATVLARAHARRTSDGRFCWPNDPTFKRSQPRMHSVAEWSMVWRHISSPVLQLMSSDPRPKAPTSDLAEAAHRRSFFRNLTCAIVADSEHNLHHDAPDAVARAIEFFVAAQPVRRSA